MPDRIEAMKDQEHVVLVPVKPPAVGKSRLVGLPDDLRRELAVAFALDTVAACLATPGVDAVLAVTDDARSHSAWLHSVRGGARRGRRRPQRLPAPGGRRGRTALAAAVAGGGVCGPAGASARRPRVGARRPARAGPSFVADAAGTGTTMYAAPLDAFDPRFGPGSRAAHLRGRARSRWRAIWRPCVRTWTTSTTCIACSALGVGPHTRPPGNESGWAAVTGDPP